MSETPDRPELILQALGAPKAQPRPRWRGTRQRPVSVIDPKVRLWQLAIERAARACLEAQPAGLAWLAGAVEVDMQFRFRSETPLRHGRPHEAKPDVDNCAKLVMDCLERVGMLPKGDQRVTGGTLSKIWAQRGGVTVTIRAGAAMPAIDQSKPLGSPVGSPEWLRAITGGPDAKGG